MPCCRCCSLFSDRCQRWATVGYPLYRCTPLALAAAWVGAITAAQLHPRCGWCSHHCNATDHPPHTRWRPDRMITVAGGINRVRCLRFAAAACTAISLLLTWFFCLQFAASRWTSLPRGHCHFKRWSCSFCCLSTVATEQAFEEWSGESCRCSGSGRAAMTGVQVLSVPRCCLVVDRSTLHPVGDIKVRAFDNRNDQQLKKRLIVEHPVFSGY